MYRKYVYSVMMILQAYSVSFTSAQSKYDLSVSAGLGASQYRINDSYTNSPNRLKADYSPFYGFSQSLGIALNKRDKKFFKRIGMQHHSTKILIKYYDFKNPLIRHAEAHQTFELRYFAYPVGFGWKFKTSKSTALSVSFFSEILATYRLVPTSNSINVVLKDNTIDNIAQISDGYNTWGSNVFGSIGCDFDFSVRLNSRKSAFIAGSFVRTPGSSQWVDFNTRIYAGGQSEYYGIGGMGVNRFFLSSGIKYDL